MSSRVFTGQQQTFEVAHSQRQILETAGTIRYAHSKGRQVNTVVRLQAKKKPYKKDQDWRSVETLGSPGHGDTQNIPKGFAKVNVKNRGGRVKKAKK